jgi:hypothetical protein
LRLAERVTLDPSYPKEVVAVAYVVPHAQFGWAEGASTWIARVAVEKRGEE